VDALIAPLAKGALRIGLTPNAVTVIGGIGSTVSAAYFFAQGRFIIGIALVALFAASDLFDGAMARLSDKGSSKWGGFLDSTFDRMTDSAILGGLIIHLIRTDSRLTHLAIFSLVLGMLIPYIRAKAESFGLQCTVGIAERTERLIIIMTGIGLDGLGVPFALSISIWILFILSAITVVQRVIHVRKGLSFS
jgi:CDP-diacylglycerol--glycerol-3-phosphate 3-phosphatidyltransferase